MPGFPDWVFTVFQITVISRIQSVQINSWFLIFTLKLLVEAELKLTFFFLFFFREIQLPAVLVQNYAPDTQASDKSPMLEPFMTVTQKKMTIDEVMSINEAVVKESSKTLVLSEEKFAVPTPDKSVEAKPIDTTETTSGGI